MQIHAWWALLVAVAVVLSKHCCALLHAGSLLVQASDLGSDYPSTTSLCGENLTKETGTLNDLYYVYYESSVKRAQGAKIPVILWLSGGPGCSGLVALLFENGPCSFDDEANQISLNPYSWTALAHVIYVDQPKGTGFSDPDSGITPPWTLQHTAVDLRHFLELFFDQHHDLRRNDFYIFGESFAGHYIPGLATELIESVDDGRSLPKLKGVGIGNGLVSTMSWADSVIPFATSNNYVADLLGLHEADIQNTLDRFKAAMASCKEQQMTESTVARLYRELNFENASDACAEAAWELAALEGKASAAVWDSLGRNVYDLRRLCHVNDPVQLCYRFSRLEDFVNTAGARAYFNEVHHEWKLCTPSSFQQLAEMDKLAESEGDVARALEQGVRVLIYGGDADTVVNWQAQDAWTRGLVWSNGVAFRSTAFVEYEFEGRRIGRVRTANGLSFMKVYNAGHVRFPAMNTLMLENARKYMPEMYLVFWMIYRWCHMISQRQRSR
ncbi:hypothetical protein BBJ28_00004435 [Nothophytophthora sp. Chile5]|nr:hypothetical protein BBJ28_00004435 [Nothophytophthora sp. Chile5]